MLDCLLCMFVCLLACPCRRFDGSGQCTSIPQLGDPKAHATATSSSRSCVKSHPVAVHKGLLWVYAAGDNNSSSAGKGQPVEGGPPAALLMPEGFDIKSPWFQRDGEQQLGLGIVSQLCELGCWQLAAAASSKGRIRAEVCVCLSVWWQVALADAGGNSELVSSLCQHTCVAFAAAVVAAVVVLLQ